MLIQRTIFRRNILLEPLKNQAKCFEKLFSLVNIVNHGEKTHAKKLREPDDKSRFQKPGVRQFNRFVVMFTHHMKNPIKIKW